MTTAFVESTIALTREIMEGLRCSPVRAHPASKFSDRVFVSVTCIRDPDPYMGFIIQPTTTILNRDPFRVRVAASVAATGGRVVDAAILALRVLLAQAGLPTMNDVGPRGCHLGFTRTTHAISSIGITTRQPAVMLKNAIECDDLAIAGAAQKAVSLILAADTPRPPRRRGLSLFG